MRFLPHIRGSELIWSSSRRRQGGTDGQESPADSGMAQEDPSKDERGSEVVELQPEPVPSARNEFHRAYTEKLQAADKDIEDYSKTLDSVSYPVSASFPLPPQQTSHTTSSPLGSVIFGNHPTSHRLRSRALLNKYVPVLA